MGQYYKPAIIQKGRKTRTLCPHDFNDGDNGAKLTETAWISNEYVNTVYSLIHNNPCRVAWIGDYALDNYTDCGEAYTRKATSINLYENPRKYDIITKGE